MNTQETKAVEEAAKTKTNEYCVSSDEVLSLKRSVIHDYMLSLFIAGAQFLDELRKPSKLKMVYTGKGINPHDMTDILNYEPIKPSVPETNVEAGEDLVKRILNIMDNNAKEDDSESEYLLGGQFEDVAREIAALMQPDKELIEALKLAKTFLHRNELSTPQWKMINGAISKYEKQSK